MEFMYEWEKSVAGFLHATPMDVVRTRSPGADSVQADAAFRFL